MFLGAAATLPSVSHLPAQGPGPPHSVRPIWLPAVLPERRAQPAGAAVSPVAGICCAQLNRLSHGEAPA